MRASRHIALLSMWAMLGLTVGSCKVGFTNIDAAWVLADITWFQDEQTLFIFYHVDAQQGLGPLSQIELSYTTDEVTVPPTSLDALPTVHTHLPVDCGPYSLCGSASTKVDIEPRDLGLRLRYNRDGEIFLNATVTFNVVGSGPPNMRSAQVYGVFDENNDQVQWRLRHTFPTVRNEAATALGLRRHFDVALDSSGAATWDAGANPYGYGFASACPSAANALTWAPVDTLDRAIFETDLLPMTDSTDPLVCATSTVTDALGPFNAVALAQKNPQVRPAFPALRNPIRGDTPVGWLLHFCTRTISQDHEDMQVQRLQLADEPAICIDGFASPGFTDSLVAQMTKRIESVRAAGSDMVITLALNHDDTTGMFTGEVEDALQQVLAGESTKSSPRVTGAFVFDSFGYTVTHAALKPLVLWCPATTSVTDLDTLTDESTRACPLQPDLPDFMLGPFKFSNLAILPTRDQYLTFIGKYSIAEAGMTTSLSFVAPERTPTSTDFAIPPFANATFFNGEVLTAAPTDAFSYCNTCPALKDPTLIPDGGDITTVCSGDALRTQVIVFESAHNPVPQPISTLPDLQSSMNRDPPYRLGILWDFPFLTRLQYQVVIAGAVSAFSISVPFGFASQSKAYYGTALWQIDDGGTSQTFALDQALTQCTRFCDAPTFDSAGVYNIGQPFRATYADQCYQPLYPTPDAGGFPLDP